MRITNPDTIAPDPFTFAWVSGVLVTWPSEHQASQFSATIAPYNGSVILSSPKRIGERNYSSPIILQIVEIIQAELKRKTGGSVPTLFNLTARDPMKPVTVTANFSDGSILYIPDLFDAMETDTQLAQTFAQVLILLASIVGLNVEM